MMIDVRELGPLQLDGLREVANIGAGHAATAMSQLTGKQIWIDVPQIRIFGIEDVGRVTGTDTEVVAAVAMQMLGDLAGRTIQIFPGPTASRLTGILLQRKEPAFPDDFGEMEQSALKEAGNIVGAAYLNALSDFLGLMLLTSVPGLAIDQAAAVLRSGTAGVAEHSDALICLDTVFRIDSEAEPVRAHFLLVPDPASLQVILRAIHLA